MQALKHLEEKRPIIVMVEKKKESENVVAQTYYKNYKKHQNNKYICISVFGLYLPR